MESVASGKSECMIRESVGLNNIQEGCLCRRGIAPESVFECACHVSCSRRDFNRCIPDTSRISGSFWLTRDRWIQIHCRCALEMDQLHIRIRADTAGFSLGIILCWLANGTDGASLETRTLPMWRLSLHLIAQVGGAQHLWLWLWYRPVSWLCVVTTFWELVLSS